VVLRKKRILHRKEDLGKKGEGKKNVGVRLWRAASWRKFLLTSLGNVLYSAEGRRRENRRTTSVFFLKKE